MTESVIMQPQIAAKNPNKKIKFLVGGVLIVAAILYLIVTSISATGAYYMSVSELNSQGAEIVGRKVRVSGPIVPESEQWDAPNLMLNFKMTDDSGEQMVVSFHGSRPSNFSMATEAIIEGEMTDAGVFRADHLMLKCPSRYEEAPEVTEFTAIQ
ncbi:MAG: cytochrome c maturation protein CcmE [Caldilineales bacterium]|nr:cytochrome c maturation protein CcmE [Caldilineales bacterium]